jgi:hypothetical protein
MMGLEPTTFCMATGPWPLSLKSFGRQTARTSDCESCRADRLRSESLAPRTHEGNASFPGHPVRPGRSHKAAWLS